MKKFLLLLLSALIIAGAQAQNGDVYNKAAALQLVQDNKAQIGMTDNDLAAMAVSSSYTDATTGITMVYLQQTFRNIPVFNKMLVLAFKNGKLVSKAGQPVEHLEKITASATPGLAPEEAVRRAFAEQHLANAAVGATFSRSADGRLIDFGKIPGTTENVTTELMWFPVEQGKDIVLKLGWQVQVAPAGSDEVWHVRIDAANGQLISKVNISISENFTQNHKPVIAGFSPVGLNKVTTDGSLQYKGQVAGGKTDQPSLVSTVNYLVIPYPYEAPSFTAAATRTNPWTAAPGNATSLGWHNDGVDYTISRGNNTWASEDTLGTNTNNGNSAVSSTNPDPLNFVTPPNYNVEPSRNPAMQQFCITNLFYWTNVMHDVTYQYGFDEPAGNYQQNNQGRGGAGNDYVMALAQSGAAGHIGNNANFLPTVDGVKGRMRMYLFDAVSSTTLHVNTPAPISGNYTAVEGTFSTNNQLANVGPVTGQVVYYNDDAGGTTHLACGPPANSLTGKIAMIDRGTCTFVAKVLAAQNAGAIAVIMVNNVAGAPITMGGTDNTITIPAVMITQSDGAIFAAQLANNVNVTLSAVQTQVLDGDLDAGIISHEYTHGISNRLTGGPATASCLQNAEEGGEGWSDYFALMMTTNWATATVNDGTIPRPVGTYVLGQPTNGSGIRNYPYCTNIAVNPLTYANMGVAPIGTEVHNIGEIWCMAAWEMTWAIIQQENAINPNFYNFSLASNGGNSIAFKLVLEGLKLQPCGPGYVDARNAILTADMNLYGGRHQCAIWTAFAKRGLGYSALQGSPNSATDQTAATDLPPAATVTTPPADLTVNAGSNAVFTVVASTALNGAYNVYNWQVSTDNGSTWNDVVPAATTATLTLNAVTASMNGYKYRCIIKRGCATTTSAAATLTVSVPGGFTFNNPAPATAACPAPASMDIVLGTVASGGFSNPITVSSSTPPAGTTVSFIPSNTVTPGNSVTVRLTGTNTLVAGSYVLTITGTASGATTQTRDITYTITPGSNPAITAQPSNQTVCAGSNTSFSITSAAATNFQWQISTDGGITYTTLANGGVYSGATTATLTITGATAGLNNNRYRCIASTLCGSSTSNAGILTVNSAPAITGQPANASVCTGSNQTFTVTATGTSLSYQWYISTDNGTTFNLLPNGGVYSGATTNALTITGVTAGLNNNQYRCVITGVCPVSPLTSNAAILTVSSTLSITGQPADVTICSGSNASFTVTAVGAGTYQWQISTDGGITYNTLNNGGVYSGATTATLTITGATAGLSGNRYRCVLASGCGNATSNAALLTVNSFTTITTQPVDAAVCTGGSNTFCVVATGSNLTYQWESAPTCAGPFSNVAGATNSCLTINAATTTASYRCKVTGSCGGTITTNCVTLTVSTSVVITTQPVNQTVCEGSNASFTVAGSGTGIVYQWQISTDGGTTYNTLNNGGVYSGATTGTLNITGATFSLNNNRYRCLLSNASCLTPTISNAAILTVNTLPAISAQPQAATICVGGNNTFSVTASGTGISYQWQVSTTGCAGTWSNITNGGVYSGVTTNALTITGAPVTMNGYAYRCVITGTCAPAATSNCVILTVGSPVVISAQPASAELCSGSNASFIVTAAGSGLIYQWQISTDGGATWNNVPGATAATLTLNSVTVAQSNSRYRCQVSSSTCAVPAISNTAVLTVRQLPTVGLAAAPLTSLLPGQSTTLTATPSASSGGVLSTSWFKNGTAFTNGTNTYVVDITNLGSYQVKIQESWPSTLVCANQSAVVTIDAAVSNRLFIFPSPNDGRFTVSYYNNGGASSSRTVTVYDSKGAEVYNAKFPITGPYTLMNIDVRPALTGIYYVVVGDASGKKLAEGKVVVH